MNANIQIRPLVLEDIDKIIALRKEIIKCPYLNFEIEKKIYEWEIKNNPYNKNGFPIGFVLLCAADIVGSVVLVPSNFKIAKEKIYACFEVNLMVLPRFRFHGLKLLNKVWNENIFPLILSTTPNAISYKIEHEMGVSDITFMSAKYKKIVNPSIFIKINQFDMKQLIKNIDMIFRAFFEKKLKLENFIVEEITKFDVRFDNFYKDISLDYEVLHVRDSSYLNWRYIDFPFGKRKIYCLVDQGKKIRGVIVIQLEKDLKGLRIANILELITGRDDTLAVSVLLKHAINFAKENNFCCLEILPPSVPIKNVLEKCGFVKKRLNFPACSYKFNRAIFPFSSEAVNKLDNWYISSGDGDTAVFSALSWAE